MSPGSPLTSLPSRRLAFARRAQSTLLVLLALPWLLSCAESAPSATGHDAVAGDARAARPEWRAPTSAERTLFAPELAARLDAAERAVQEHPHEADAWLELAMLCDANDLALAAVTAYEQAAALVPGDPRPVYHLARVLERSGEAARARQELRAALTLAPQHVPGHLRLGQWLLAAGERQAAAHAFRAALALEPDSLHAGLGLARVAIAEHDGDAAIARLAPLRASHPQVGELRFLLGSAYRLLGRMDEARAELAGFDARPAAFFDPWEGEVARHTVGYQAVMEQVVDWGRSGQAGLARPALETLHRENPDDSAVLEKLVQVLLETGEPAQAEAVLGAALRRDAGHYRSFHLLALAHEASGELPAALAAAAQSLHLHPTWARGHELIARLRWKAGDLRGAVDAMQAALDSGGPRAVTLLKLARAQALLRDWPAARATLERTVELEPRSASVAALLAEACAESGDLPRAWAELARARALDDSQPQVAAAAARLAQLDPDGAAGQGQGAQ